MLNIYIYSPKKEQKKHKKIYYIVTKILKKLNEYMFPQKRKSETRKHIKRTTVTTGRNIKMPEASKET